MLTEPYPGVHVREIPSGVRTIMGVSTSTACFIGRTKKGQLNKPTLITSFEDFDRKFSSKTVASDLARSVKLFFANGGNRAYIVRIADSSTVQAATSTLHNEGNAPSLAIEAKSPGIIGDTFRVAVDYNTALPETTFNMTVFRWDTNSSGAMEQAQLESHINLSMDPANSRYVKNIVNRDSQLITVNDLNVSALPGGYSQSGFAVSNDDGTGSLFRDQWMALIGSAVSTNRFMISVDGLAPREVDLSSIDFTDAGHPFPVDNNANAKANLDQRIQDIINNDVLSGSGSAVTVSMVAGPNGPAGQDNETTVYLRITSNAKGNVTIDPAVSNDLAVTLMLGTGQGGLEVGAYADGRPAPTGNVTALADMTSFAEMEQVAFDHVVVDGASINVNSVSYDVRTNTTVTSPRMYQDASASDQNDGRAGVREKLGILASAINSQRISDPNFRYSAAVWGNRLAIIPLEGGDNAVTIVSTQSGGGAGPDISASALENTRFYSLGTSGTPQFQTAGLPGLDGGKPQPLDYSNAYRVIDKEVDIFNLLILPADHDHSNAEQRALWGPASVFCHKRRAFLLIDPPSDWTDAQTATDAAIGVNSLRVGLVKNRAAVFFPKVHIRDRGIDAYVGASGAIAGLMARIDGTRGVWKAPAGVEADLRGVLGIQHLFSDSDNATLNPKAVNTIRLFPNGIVSWGSRSMDGDDAFASEWKYVPVIRTALFLEESLYRGLKWAVFEPNDEPLWAQIRLNVGAFMHNLFRQGAFQGKTPREAYSVQCDANTTTQNDIDQGIVNIIVGFAPLKPAEFVILHIQQIAGQVQV